MPLAQLRLAPLALSKHGLKTSARLVNATLSAKIVEALPPTANAYARLSRMQAPIGTYLLFLPCSFSTALSGVPLQDQLYYNSIMLFGAFCMRGAGCIVREWDLQVKKILLLS